MVGHWIPHSDALYSKLHRSSMVDLALHLLEIVILSARYCWGLGSPQQRRLLFFFFFFKEECIARKFLRK